MRSWIRDRNKLSVPHRLMIFYSNCYYNVAPSLFQVIIDIGLMASEGNCAPNSEGNTLSHSEKKAKLADLWHRVVRNPEFKNLLLGYTLEQLARHSQLESIRRYCNYHTSNIPSSEEEEDGGSDVGVSQQSELASEETRRQSICSSGHRNSGSAREGKLMILDQRSNSMYVRGSRHTDVYADSPRTPQEATSSRPARKQSYEPNRHGLIGAGPRASNTGGPQSQNGRPENFRDAPWRHRSK